MKKNVSQKKVLQWTGNILFFGFFLLVLFNPGAKAWMLRQLMAAGLFKAKIENTHLDNVPAYDLSFDYADANGNRQSISDLKGKVVFINFWATWCPPCIAEMPSLDALYHKMKNDDRLVFLFINQDDEIAKAKQYLEKNGYEIPLYSSIGNIPAELYSGTLPTTILLNKKGSVVMKHEGMADYKNKDFLNQLNELLK